MDSFNKVISFVLGLVVVIVFFLVLTGKINLKNRLSSTTTPTPTAAAAKSTNNGFFNLGGLLSRPTSTPTPTQKPTSISSVTITGNNTYNQTGPAVKTGKTIPSTGLPTIFIPTLISGLLGGGFLSRFGKRKS